MKTLNIIGLCLLLSGCAFSQIESGLGALRGQKIQTAFNYLGYPDTEQDIAGDKVYTWGTSYTVTSVQAFSTGLNTAFIPQTNNYNCQIKIISDKQGNIKNGQYKGNLGGCTEYGTALANVADDLGIEDMGH